MNTSMSKKSKSRSTTAPAGWGLRLAGLALTLLSVVVIYAVRFSGNGDNMAAMLWAAAPILLGVIACMVLGQIKKLSSPKRKWEIYTYVLIFVAVGILVKTWFF